VAHRLALRLERDQKAKTKFSDGNEKQTICVGWRTFWFCRQHYTVARRLYLNFLLS